jgi:hypothetical protein
MLVQMLTRSAKIAENLACDTFRLLDRVGTFYDQGEFVPAKTRNRAQLPNRGAQAVRYRLQKRVASVMPTCIVDDLEVVEIKHHQREFLRMLVRVRQRLL